MYLYSAVVNVICLLLLINNSFTTYSNIKAFNCFYSEFCLTLLLLVIVSKILSTKKVLLKSRHYIFY